jgi:hypothetical protein
VLARRKVEKFPMTQAAVEDCAKASERWIDLVLKTGDFVQDCPR